MHSLFVYVYIYIRVRQVDGGANEINANATTKEALGVEFGCTFLLVMTIMAATDTTRADTHKHIPTIAPLVIGMAVTAAHFIAIPVDNCEYRRF